MRIVAVSMVKDEDDVIEAFVRHTAAFVDHLVIFDHHSTDRTAFVLHQLRAEGLPLTILTDDEFEYRQAARTTALLRFAEQHFQASWYLPLDCDEFLQAASPKVLRESLAACPQSPIQLPLVNFGPHPSDDSRELNPVLRFRHKLQQVQTSKVAIPRSLVQANGFAVGTGNHDVALHGVVQPALTHTALWLAHFPIRSGWQAACKVALHETQRAAGGYGAGGTHYSLHFARLLHDPARFLAEPEQYLRGEVLQPSQYLGHELQYTPTPDADPQRLTRALLALVQRLAISHERWRTRAEKAQLPGIWRRIIERARRWLGLVPDQESFGFRAAEVPDSRTPGQFRGDVRVLKSEVSGGVLSAVVRVRNTGAALWRAESGAGQVNLGAQAIAADGQVIRTDWHRAGLPEELAPGEVADIPLICPVPTDPDSCLNLDLVSEGVAWFGCRVPITPPAPPSTS